MRWQGGLTSNKHGAMQEEVATSNYSAATNAQRPLSLQNRLGFNVDHGRVAVVIAESLPLPKP